MPEDRWTENRHAPWTRGPRRDRPENRDDYGQADYREDRSYAPRASESASAGRRFDEPADDRGYGSRGPRFAEPPHRYDTSGQSDFEASQRRRHAGDYDPDRYTPNPREGRGEEGRSWWDRTQDELSAWFGDDEAKRRREWDERRATTVGEHRGRGPKGYRRSDERMRDDVNDRLTDDPHLDASEIEVAVAEGEVTLSGSVFRREDKRRAEDLAGRVSGVNHVQNNLRLNRPGGTLG